MLQQDFLGGASRAASQPSTSGNALQQARSQVPPSWNACPRVPLAGKPGRDGTMPRYYFHAVLGPVYIHDAFGADLPNEGAARGRAIEDIKDLWKSSSIRQRSPAECTVVVAVEDDKELFRVPFVEAPGVLPDH